eukprot:scpid41435/ scgid9945/ 
MATWTPMPSSVVCWNGVIPHIRLDPVLPSCYSVICSRHVVQAHHSSFAPKWKQRATRIESSDSPPVPDPDSSQPRTLSKLTIGMHVDLQDPRTKRWTGRGIVVAIGTHRDYYVKLRSGRVFWRNRRFLRPYVPLLPDRVSTDSASEPAVPAPAEPVVAPRRSTRNRRQPDRLNISAHQGQSYV